MRGSTVRPAGDPHVEDRGPIVMRRELMRKLLHFSSVAVPLFVWHVPRPVAITATVGGAALALGIEAFRFGFRPFRRLFLLRTRRLLRRHERLQLTGATYLAVSFALAMLVFPTPVAVLAMLYSGVGDASAAVVGRSFGRHRLRSGKSWQGGAAMFAVALLAGLLLPGIPAIAALTGAAAAMALELADLPPDDNLWVTLGGGAAVWAMI